MDMEVFRQKKVMTGGARTPGKPFRKTQRDRALKLIEELQRRAWDSEPAMAGLLVLELLATHSHPPAALLPFRDAIAAALSPRLPNERRAELLIDVATELRLIAASERWAPAASMLLREYAISLGACPAARMAFIKLCQREMGLLPLKIETAVPRLPISPEQSLPANMRLSELINIHIQELCAIALHEACVSQPYIDWSMSDIDAALFALRFHYVNLETTLCGEAATASQRQKDLRNVGLPLWNALRQAAVRLAASTEGRPPARDDAWHRLTQSAVFLAINDSADIPAEVSPEAPTVQSPPAGPSRVVCVRPLVPSSDLRDAEELERHRVLERPLPLALMPRCAEIAAAHNRLLMEFPWAEDVLQTVFDDLLGRAAIGVSALGMPPTLLVGHAGSGKSRLARRLAEELRIPRLDFCLGGISDSKMLCGTSRGWGSGKPCDLATLMAMRESASAIVILDELDKAHDGQREGPGIQAYLLGLLEPETAARHHDVFLKTECDFSGVLWIATANRLTGISPTLLTRMRVLILQQPGPEHHEVIARAVIADVAGRWCVDRQVLPELRDLDVPLHRLSSARQVRQATEAAITCWAKRLQHH